MEFQILIGAFRCGSTAAPLVVLFGSLNSYSICVYIYI